VWWHTPVILALERLRRRLIVRSQPELHSKILSQNKTNKKLLTNVSMESRMWKLISGTELEHQHFLDRGAQCDGQSSRGLGSGEWNSLETIRCHTMPFEFSESLSVTIVTPYFHFSCFLLFASKAPEWFP
jgi:hypothetical protein